MLNIKTLVNIKGKRVLLRANFDVPLCSTQGKLVIADDTRILESLPTIKYLLGQKAQQIIIISHLGRPEGKVVPELSLEPVAQKLAGLLNLKFKIENFKTFKIGKDILLLENLRFDSSEEANDEGFAKKLSLLGDFFVNDAFAASHREHASIVGVPKFFPPDKRALGFEFLKEIELLTKVRENPARPVVLILGGGKEDKLEQLTQLTEWADQVLIGGRLPAILGKEVQGLKSSRVQIASLNPEGKDITPESAAEFKKVIALAKTVVWAGPVGDFYDEKQLAGTKAIAEAVAESSAFTVIGGGDTEAALTKFGLTERINFISSGGGAMLAFLAQGDLPGLKAIC